MKKSRVVLTLLLTLVLGWIIGVTHADVIFQGAFKSRIPQPWVDPAPPAFLEAAQRYMESSSNVAGQVAWISPNGQMLELKLYGPATADRYFIDRSTLILQGRCALSLEDLALGEPVQVYYTGGHKKLAKVIRCDGASVL